MNISDICESNDFLIREIESSLSIKFSFSTEQLLTELREIYPDRTVRLIIQSKDIQIFLGELQSFVGSSFHGSVVYLLNESEKTHQKEYESPEIITPSKPSAPVISDKPAPETAISKEAKRNREFMEMLKIPQNPNRWSECEQSQEGVEHYYKILLESNELANLRDTVRKNMSVSGFNIILKKLNDYCESTENFRDKILKKFRINPEDALWDCSKKVIRDTVKNIKFYLVEAVIAPVIEKFGYMENTSDIQAYKELIKAIVAYIGRAGFYSYDKAQAGDADREEFVKYFDEDIPAKTSVASLHGKIKALSYLPYITGYYDDERKKTAIITGKKIIYCR